MEKLFKLAQKCNKEKIDLLRGLVILFMNSLYGIQIRTDINESYYCK